MEARRTVVIAKSAFRFGAVESSTSQVQTFDEFDLFFVDGPKAGSAGSVDICPRHGLETAGLGRHGRRRDKAHFCHCRPVTHGLSEAPGLSHEGP
jgi:hypothetical protein